jgi:hypothetical protein
MLDSCAFHNSSCVADYWELDSTTGELLEPDSKKAGMPEGLQPVYPQRSVPCSRKPCMTVSAAVAGK